MIYTLSYEILTSVCLVDALFFIILTLELSKNSEFLLEIL